jgi:transposase
LEAGLRSRDAFVLRRCQLVLGSAAREPVPVLAKRVGRTERNVHAVLDACEARGRDSLQRRSSRPHTIHVAFPAAQAGSLKALRHQGPRTFGKPTSLWTLELAADISFEQGLTSERVTGETIRATLVRLGVRWQRAKDWITSPDPEYGRKKARARRIRLAQTHPEWVLAFEDEGWWSRLAHPALHAWATPDHPLRLVEQSGARDDPDPKALACYGLFLPAIDEVWLRFVDSRPVSARTTQFLAWCCDRLAAQGKTALLLVWDNAGWHISREVHAWLREHTRQVRRAGTGVRLLACPLPSHSPWLNPIEPKWVHAKRRVVEPDRLLPARDLAARACVALGCPYEEHLARPKQVA